MVASFLPRQEWTAARTAELCALLTQDLNLREIAEAMGLTQRSISGRVHKLRIAGDARVPTERREGMRKARPVPTDFAERASASNTDLGDHYGVRQETVTRWRKEAGIPATGNKNTALPPPSNFATIAPSMNFTQARTHFRAGRSTLDRWTRETGVALRDAGSPPVRFRLKMDRDDARDMSRASMGADFLRRFGPVFRCDSIGAPATKGTHWRRGNAVLTGDELIERAERQGWQPDAWRSLPTTIQTTNGERV